MTSPDDFNDLEQQLTRVFRSHGDSIEPSPDSYGRLARAVNEPPGRFRQVRAVFGPLREGNGPAGPSGDSLRPLVFVAAVIAVAGLGGYGLTALVSSPADTATAAPATADASDLVPGSDYSTESETGVAETDRLDATDSESADAPLADIAEEEPEPSVSSDSAATGAATSSVSDPVEQFAGLTYAPVRVTELEAAQAFLDLLAIDDVVLEVRADRVVVRASSPAADTDAGSAIMTTLTIGAKGDGFVVVDARSDQLALAIDNASTADPTEDDIVDETVVTGPIEVSGSTANPGTDVTVSLRSVIDGSHLEQTSAVAGSTSDPDGGYRLTLPTTGTERAWIVAIATDPVDGVRSLAARSMLYTGGSDDSRYTVVGLPPDDPDGGLVVRSSPNGQRVGVIELGSTDVRRRPVPPRAVDGLTWWAVVDATGLEGWAAARYLAVDETPAEATMVELGRLVVAAATEGDSAVVDRLGLATPVFVGSIIDPRPISGLADVQALLTTRRRLVRNGGAGATADFYGFDQWSEADVFVPKGYRQDGAADGARAFFGDLPSVVIRSFNPETGGWERVHLFVSRDGDRPTLIGLVLESEPIVGSAAEDDRPGSSPPSDSGG